MAARFEIPSMFAGNPNLTTSTPSSKKEEEMVLGTLNSSEMTNNDFKHLIEVARSYEMNLLARINESTKEQESNKSQVNSLSTASLEIEKNLYSFDQKISNIELEIQQIQKEKQTHNEEFMKKTKEISEVKKVIQENISMKQEIEQRVNSKGKESEDSGRLQDDIANMEKLICDEMQEFEQNIQNLSKSFDERLRAKRTEAKLASLLERNTYRSVATQSKYNSLLNTSKLESDLNEIEEFEERNNEMYQKPYNPQRKNYPAKKMTIICTDSSSFVRFVKLAAMFLIGYLLCEILLSVN